jgi:hypothetical protein
LNNDENNLWNESSDEVENRERIIYALGTSLKKVFTLGCK